jgi:bacterial/archaeal transporter family-2 protein
MKILYYLLPILAGVAITIQSGINSQLRAAIQHPLMAAFISFLCGTVVLAFLLMFSRQSFPSMGTYQAVNWYKFTGGLLGAFVVFVALISVQRIGASNMFILIIAGQLLTAILMDHFGVFGMKVSPINAQKAIGILLVVLGAYLVNRK